MCDLIIVNYKKFLLLQISSLLLIIAATIFQDYTTISTFLSMIAWGIIVYIFYVRYHDNLYKILPLVIGAAIGNILMNYHIGFAIVYAFCLGGLAFYTIEEEWSLAIVLTLTVVHGWVIWQKSQKVIDDFAVPIEAFVYTMISAMYSLPVSEELKDASCLDEIVKRIPQLSPYRKEIECVVTSGCFDNLTSITNPQEIIKSITCAGEKCNIYKQISLDIDCFVTNCMQTLLQNPPDSPIKWASQILSLYTTCGVPKCKLPPPF